jgi:hypothetical protein
MISFAQFTADYPEFASANQAQFTLYQNRAVQYLVGSWGPPAVNPTDPSQYTQYDFGMELIIAHFLALAAFRAKAAAAGGPPLGRGVISSESAGPNTVSYDIASATEEDAGHWNLTDYGRDFIQQARLIGAAPTQASPGAQCGPNNGPAWSGNWPSPVYCG